MKYFQSTIIALIFCVNLGAQGFYDPTVINDIEIEFEQDNWDAILDSYFDDGDRLAAMVTINGVLFDSVGVKFKGNSSYDEDRIKNPLSLKLDYYINQDYEGYETLKLSNVWRDPSFVREPLAYEIARKYTTAPQANFTRVFINGEYWGLYTNVEAINKDFLEPHYSENDGPFFKGDITPGQQVPGCPSGPPQIWAYLGTDSACYELFYELEGDNGYAELINMLDVFNNDEDNMEEVLNIDRHLWALAFDNTLANLDAPNNIPHNFYMYEDINGRFNHLIWDVNLCFGTFGNGNGTPQSLNGMQELDIDYHNTSSFPIIYQALQNPMYKRMYVAHMKTILAENIGNGEYLERIETLQALIDTDVEDDENKFYTYNDFQNNIDNTIDGLYGIAELMEGRNDYLLSTPEFSATQPTIDNISSSPEEVTAYSNVFITAEITDLNYVYLGYRYNQFGKFEKTEMFDDGMHEDGSAGDGIFGAEVPVEATDLQYYIYAENADAGIFSPVRAEYEFHSLAVSGELVINEFMASNSTTIEDDEGEYDDWIELYNNSDVAIALEDYFLSDNPNNMEKWPFPSGTSIGSEEYLIIWADEDSTNVDLHANFKLSANGESLMLTDGTSILDEVVFGTQTTDMTFGRYPNGHGPFTMLYPTFNAENQNTVSVSEMEDSQELRAYPNPANDILNIVSDWDGISNYELYNISGKLVQSGSFYKNTELNVSGMENGVYLLRVENSVLRLVIAR